jgi:glucose-6-phosphate 1-dehydrogenase
LCAWTSPGPSTTPYLRDARKRKADTVVMYLATAPSLFTTICEQIAASG